MSDGGHCGSKPKPIAIGVAPLGTISIGIVPMGVICIGVVPMGVVSIGVVAMGVINAAIVGMGLVAVGVNTVVMRLDQVTLDVVEGLHLDTTHLGGAGAGTHGRVFSAVDELADDEDCDDAFIHSKSYQRALRRESREHARLGSQKCKTTRFKPTWRKLTTSKKS